LQPAPSPTDFLANPTGRYHLGRRHCVFAHSPTVLGFASWGRPDVDDVSSLLRLCAIGLAPGIPPYRWLVDLRGLELVVPATFGLFLEYTRKNRDTLGRSIVRQAQLRPDGMVGAVISGFSLVARLPYPERVFGDIEEALAWLEIEHREGVELIAELDALRSSGTCEGHSIVGKLRQELDAAGALAVDKAARRLGLSTRSLQRALQQGGTTYRIELKSFRIRRAQELLRHGEESLTRIAAEVGFSSAQHLATAFRRAVGETPSAWRAGHRGTAS
jgi:AraC-like DNA-binding protein